MSDTVETRGPGRSVVTIRPAVRTDLPDLGRLGALLVAWHHELDSERFIAATPKTPDGYAWFLGTQLDEPAAAILVAEAEGAVAGYAYGSMEGNDWMALRGPAGVVQDIVVDPGHRRRGIGRLLLEAIIAELAARGAPRFVLSTAERNEDARRLFAKAGFRPTMIEMTREAE